MQIRRLRWNEWNIEHIQRHGVSQDEQDEVEDVCYSKHFAIKSGRGKMALWGQTADGRYLLVVLVIEDYGDHYPISVRDMDQKEKKQYRKWIKR